MSIFLTVLHVVVCLVLIVVVLLQRGKGAEIGAVFGGGASTTVFGSRGAGNFFTRLTTGAAAVFMVTSLALSYMGGTTGDELFPEEIEEPAQAPLPEDETSPFVELPGADAGTGGEAAGGDSPFVEVPQPGAAEPEAAEPAAEGAPAEAAEPAAEGAPAEPAEAP